MPDKLPDDDACYIVSKYIYLKKRSDSIDSMVRVDSIDMASDLPEYAHMNLPKIKAKVFGGVAGFFRMTYKEYKSEAGVILNLKTHPQKENLKKIDYTVPQQRVSGGGCKYEIVVDPSYVNCGTIHSHANFGAFHSSTDVNDEKYFDGLHITVGHNGQDKISISACIAVNGKRIKVNPLNYIDGLKFVETVHNTDYYEFLDKSLVVEDRRYLKYVTPMYQTHQNTFDWSKDIISDPGKPFDWFEGEDTDYLSKNLKESPCESCVYKELKLESALEDIEFDDEGYDDDDFLFTDDDRTFTNYDRVFFEDTNPIFEEGDIDHDGIRRSNNKISYLDYANEKRKKIKKSIKCKCGTTFFTSDPESPSICPNCEKEHPAQEYTFDQFITEKTEPMRNEEKGS